MDAEKILSHLSDALTAQLAPRGAAVVPAFGAQPAPARRCGEQVSAGIGRLSDTLEIKLSVCVSLARGAQACEELWEELRAAVEGSGIPEFAGLERGAVSFDAASSSYRLEARAVYREVAQLVFGAVTLLCYPETVRISDGRTLKKYNAPLLGEVVQDLGLRARVLTGQGSVSKAGFAALYQAFRGAQKDELSLRGGGVMEAVFSGFTSWERPGCICYEFEFSEVPAL